METILIACASSPLEGIKYQLILKHHHEKTDLQAVNILNEKKILVKIKADDTKIEFIMQNAEMIAMDYIYRRLMQSKANKNNSSKVAKQNAVNDLMQQFNL